MDNLSQGVPEELTSPSHDLRQAKPQPFHLRALVDHDLPARSPDAVSRPSRQPRMRSEPVFVLANSGPSRTLPPSGEPVGLPRCPCQRRPRGSRGVGSASRPSGEGKQREYRGERFQDRSDALGPDPPASGEPRLVRDGRDATPARAPEPLVRGLRPEEPPKGGRRCARAPRREVEAIVSAPLRTRHQQVLQERPTRQRTHGHLPAQAPPPAAARLQGPRAVASRPPPGAPPRPCQARDK